MDTLAMLAVARRPESILRNGRRQAINHRMLTESSHPIVFVCSRAAHNGLPCLFGPFFVIVVVVLPLLSHRNLPVVSIAMAEVERRPAA
jgi:hypothetical protein